jgi:hypothetical protein
MITVRPAYAALLAFAFIAASPAAEEKEAPKSNMKEILRARIAEDAKKADAKKAPANPATQTSTPSEPAKTETAPAPVATTPPAPAPAKEKATVLPKVEVQKRRITVLDQQLAKQDEDIARERKNLKASEVDLALNDSKIAKPLAVFGGESTQFRQRVASERVQLMEAEKDIMEAIARAKTKEEKAELQKQLDEIKTFRRELDKSLR